MGLPGGTVIFSEMNVTSSVDENINYDIPISKLPVNFAPFEHL